MISYIENNTSAYIKKLELQPDITQISISEYKHNNNLEYIVYVLKNDELFNTLTLKVNDNILKLIITNKKYKNIYINATVIIVPLNDKFSNDIRILEDTLHNEKFATLINKNLLKIVLTLHFFLPLFGLIYLSANVMSLSEYFNLSTETISITSQINILYQTLLSLFNLLLESIYELRKVFFILLIVAISFMIIINAAASIWEDKSYQFFFKNSIFLKNIHLRSDKKSIITSIIFIYLITLFNTIIFFYKDIKQIHFNYNITKSEISRRYLNHDLKSIILDNNIKYISNTLFPKVVKLKTGDKIIIREKQDDMIVYYTYDDFYTNLKSKENNNSIYKRLCIDNNKASNYFNFTMGINFPKSNIAPISILENSKNYWDDFDNKAKEYKVNLCKNITR